MRLEPIPDYPSKRVFWIGWCSVCRRTFRPLTHANLDGPAFMAYVCSECAEKILEKSGISP